MNGNDSSTKLAAPTLSGSMDDGCESHAGRAEHWLNLCNFTNLQQKLQLLKNDPQWAATYEQLQLDPQLLLKTYRLPDSQIQKNWQTYVELVQAAGDPNTKINEQVSSNELLRLVQLRVEQVLQGLQERLDAFPPEMQSKDNGEHTQVSNKDPIKLRDIVAYGLFNVISAYAVYDPAIDICSAQKRFVAEDQGKYCPELGLCQLMASILYHTRDEVSSFWIAVSLVEYYDMRQFYQRGLPGLTLYGEVLNSLLETHLPDLNLVLVQYDITYLDFFEEWANSQFLNQMPLDLSLKCLGEFLSEGWPFFFRLCLSILKSLQGQIHSLDKANQEKPKRQKISSQNVSEQILAVLRFQEPRTDYRPEQADDISAMENFKNLNETANDAVENFDDIDDEQKQFDNNFAIVDDKPKEQRSNQAADLGRGKYRSKQSRIVVNRQKINNRSASECPPMINEQESLDGQRKAGGLFKRFKDMIGLSKEDEKKQAQKMQELKRIQNLLGNPRDLTSSDFVHQSRETWSYLLEIVRYEWIIQEKQEALCASSGISSSINNSQTDLMKPENLDYLLSSEFQRDYQVSKDLVQQLLAQKQNTALRKFLDWQKKQQEKERDLMMDKARKDQLEAVQNQAERKETAQCLSGHSAFQDVSEGTQGGVKSRRASRSRDRAEAPERTKSGTPLLSYGAGQSIVQFDALNSSKNGAQPGAFGTRRPSYTGSVFNHPRGSIQSTDAFKPPIESNYRYSGPAGLGVSLNLDFAASVAGGHVAGPRQIQGPLNTMGVGTTSQVLGINASNYPGLFNEADVSMMDEMNKLLMGLGGAADQDPKQRGSQRFQKSSTPTPSLPPSNLHVVEVKSQGNGATPALPKTPLAIPAQRNSTGNQAILSQPKARQSYESSSCMKSTRLDKEEQEDLIIGGGGIGAFAAKGQGRNSINSQNLSRISQFAHMENISKIEVKPEEVYDNFGDVSLQKCLQLGQQSFQNRNSERNQASLKQKSIVKNERPQNDFACQEQFKLNLQRIDDQAAQEDGAKELRVIDEQPQWNEYTPNKLLTGQQPAPGAPRAAEASADPRSPASVYSRTGFGNDQFNFKDTSQITTGERDNLQALDMRDWIKENQADQEQHNLEKPERDRTRERPVDQYVSPQNVAKKNGINPVTPAWKQAPTQSQYKDRRTKLDFQRRPLASYQHQNQGNDATLVILPDKAGQQNDSFGVVSPGYKQAGASSRFDRIEPRDHASITSPQACRQAFPQSTPGFAQPVTSKPPFAAPYNPPATPNAASSSNKIQIQCMPQTKKRNYFDNNFVSFGAGANATASPTGAAKPSTLHGHNVQLLKQKPLTIKTVTPMKLLMLNDSPSRQEKPENKEKGEKIVPNNKSSKYTIDQAADLITEPGSRSQAIMHGKRTNNMQRQTAMEDAGKGVVRPSRHVDRAEQAERDVTPVIAESRHQGRHMRKFPEILSQTSAAKDQAQLKREISKIIVEDCGDYGPADGNRQLESLDQVQSGPHEQFDRSKMERSALGTSANDSKRSQKSMKKSLSMSKNLSRSIRNLKHDEIPALLNFQGFRQEINMDGQAPEDRPLSPMFNGAQEDCSRPEAQVQSAQASPAACAGQLPQPGVVVGVDEADSPRLPSPIRPPESMSAGGPKQEEVAVPVLVDQAHSRPSDVELQQNSAISAKQQAIKEKMQKIQEMKKQQKNKLGNNSTFGGGGDNQTRVSQADRTNGQNNSSKSLGLGLNASSSLIFGRGGCNSSKNNLNNTNQSQEGKLAFQLNQSKMTNRTNRTNRSKGSGHSSSYSNKLKNKVSNQLADKQGSLNFESPTDKYGNKALRVEDYEEQDIVDAIAIDIDRQNEPRKSLSAPKSERTSYKRRLAGDKQEHALIQNCSVEESQSPILDQPQLESACNVDQDIEKELKKLAGDALDSRMPEFALPKAEATPVLGDSDLMAQPRGSGNDMQFWFAGQQSEPQPRGSGNDPQFKNALNKQRGSKDQVHEQLEPRNSRGIHYELGGQPVAEQSLPTSDDLKTSMPPIARPSSAGAALDPRQKQKKVKAIQDFINNAKKNKFSEWRKQKQLNQTRSSDNQSQGHR